MTLSIIAKNTSQASPKFDKTGSATTQDFAMYTVPANKKAILDATLLIDTFGGSTQINIKVNGTSIKRFILGTDAVNSTTRLNGVALGAGEIFEKDDNSNGNSNIRFNLSIQESPA